MDNHEDSRDLLADLAGDFGYWNWNQKKHITIGWTRDMDHNSYGYVGGSFCVAAMKPSVWWRVDWGRRYSGGVRSSHNLGTMNRGGVFNSCILG